MQKGLILLFCALLAILSACHGDDEDEANEFLPSREASIWGIVRDEKTELPISGATVTTSPATERLTTGDSGEYQFLNLPPGRYTVTVKAPGYEIKYDDVDFNGGQPTRADFSLAPQELIVTPLDLAFGPDDTVREVTIGKPRKKTLIWTIADTYEPWLEVEPRQGKVGALSVAVRVVVRRDKLPPGDPQPATEFTVRSDGGDATITVTALKDTVQVPRLPRLTGKIESQATRFARPPGSPSRGMVRGRL